MGSSVLQFLILQFLFRQLALHDPDEAQYIIANNEAGIHLGPNSHAGVDLALYKIKHFTPERITTNYADFPPQVVIEVDISVEAESIGPMDGVYLKTQRLLDFGVQKVIWIFTNSKKILVATNEKPWLTQSWDKPIEPISGLTLNIAQYLSSELATPYAPFSITQSIAIRGYLS